MITGCRRTPDVLVIGDGAVLLDVAGSGEGRFRKGEEVPEAKDPFIVVEAESNLYHIIQTNTHIFQAFLLNDVVGVVVRCASTTHKPIRPCFDTTLLAQSSVRAYTVADMRS